MKSWKSHSLMDLALSIDYGVTASSNQNAIGPKFLRITDIQEGLVDWDTVPYCECSESEASKARLNVGDIVFARTGATTGKSFLIKSVPTDAVFASYLIRVRLKDSIFPSYISHFFQSRQYWEQITKSSRGAAQPGVNSTSLKELIVPLPPLPEQRRIAEILDQAEALRANRRAALVKLDSLVQSIFLDMFGDPESHSWQFSTIERVADPTKGSIRTGPFGSQLLHSEFVDQGVAVLGIDNAVRNEFQWGEKRYITVEKYKTLSRYKVYPGDILITIMGTCGRCAIVPSIIPEAINTKHLCCITPDHSKALPEFIHSYFLKHPIALKYLGSLAKGAIMDGLNMGIIKNMPIPLPPLPLQQTYARRIEAIEALKERHRTSLAKLDALFASLQHRAFRGEL